ncbi:Cell division protein FtsH [Rhodopirellula islandica]|uniref:ATP-dependent zinc metalloprotease FtsH n=1 Tax=Rhodopirellula islandica TaxID=595434 RepID=A0A0J1BGB4_RHOIS|nr:Cell division protein FtsH [Rhodopirellula islandica]
MEIKLDQKKGDSTDKSANEPSYPQWQSALWYFSVLLLVLWLWQDFSRIAEVQRIPYSEFKAHVVAGEVTECELSEDTIEGVYVPHATPAPESESKAEPTSDETASDPQPITFVTNRVEDPELVDQLTAANVKFTGSRPPSVMQNLLLWWVLPLVAFLFLSRFLANRIGNTGQAMMGFGRSKAKLVADEDTGVRFTDVAGCVEAKFELEEVVDFLKNPERYVDLGAKIPKGVLLVGPPGTGKTLLARAVAGEAGVPFFSISGSEFVEMFVGVGAARVRDLFEQGKKHAPCIIFIDELDAIGRERGVHVATVNDEREQTLNQLLVELDGFAANTGVIILSATNRPEVLDRALLRPGRFDRQVLVDAPDFEGRLGILSVHARNKPLDESVDLRDIARSTPGLSGADLANVMNEAALLAARRKSKSIARCDLEEAVEKVVAGPERKSRRLGEEERRRVAFHEVGHALVATFSEHAEPVRKISIIPRGQAALGYTLQLPTEDQYLMTRSELDDRLSGLLGGRAAEQIVFGEVSSGAENDLQKATTIARQMVCMFGMSDSVGLTHCAQQPNAFTATSGVLQRDCSEHTASSIDDEVKSLLAIAYAQAQSILTEHREALNRVATELLEHETLDASEFQALLPGPVQAA